MKSHVYVFGSGDCGQLGMGEEVDMAKKPRLHSYFENISIIDIAAGGLHSLALSASGEVYSWGCNDEKALGHDAPEFTVAKVEGLDGIKIIQVSAGDSISAALSEDGKVYTWGTFRDSKGVLGHHHQSIYDRQTGGKRAKRVIPSSEEGEELLQDRPMLIESLLPYRIVNIAAGSNHLTAVTNDGKIFAWGSGEQGQLGRRVLERHKSLALRPTNVTPRVGRQRLQVKHVECGSYHTLVFAEVSASKLQSSQSMINMLGSSQDSLSSDTPAGSILLFSMGLNNYGQLGLADHEDRMTPELIDPAHMNSIPIAASAGEHHSLVLGANGEAFAFGRGDSGQLGVPLPEGVRASNLPIKITTLPESIALIAAGGNHNMAVGHGGRLYTWGYGEMHQLGHGPDNIEVTPRLVDFAFNGKISKVSAGGQHSLVLTHSP